MQTRNLLVVALGFVWCAAVSAGIVRLAQYANAPGGRGDAPALWPDASALPHDARQATLLVFAHPKCPCTRATVGELSILMARVRERAGACVVIVRPQGAPQDWTDTDLAKSAAEIPGVTVRTDEGGVEALRFGAATSGLALLYDAAGALVFSGGITASRGHSGDNAGRAALEALVLGHSASIDRTPVFGCSLLSPTCSGGEEIPR